MGLTSIRSAIMFALSAVTCPCHLPLLLPFLLPLLAGTPAAVWLTHYTGWVYGGLALLFLLSLTLALRWSRQPDARHCTPKSLTVGERVTTAALPETGKQVAV